MTNKFLRYTLLATQIALFVGWSTSARAICDRFAGSTMDEAGGAQASWRTDYPEASASFRFPWEKVDFRSDPSAYMEAVKGLVEPYFDYSRDGYLVGTGSEPWWIAPWMDFMSSGRERRMGLTKERGPRRGDLSPTSSQGSQVWAVGFYNDVGATVLGEIFEDACDPAVPVRVLFPENTVAIKFLFTDADVDEVSYLSGAPEFSALIDPSPTAAIPRPPSIPRQRVESTVRLIQMDIAVKDRRAATTNWVFGTFTWINPTELGNEKINDRAPKGDVLFENLVPTSLQWGNDPGVYDEGIKESWINTNLEEILFGWKERPTLGFNGRANGPADNIRSSCLSCHATARTPRSSFGLLGSRFDMESDIGSQTAVKAHVDRYFQNIRPQELFAPEENAVASLDYSLQLEAGFFRMCRACQTGFLSGPTPQICKASGFFTASSCASGLSNTQIPGSGFSARVDHLRTYIDDFDPDDLDDLLFDPPARQ